VCPPSGAVFLAAFYRTFEKIMQDWKINYSNDAFEKAARLRLLDSLGMSQEFDVPVNPGHASAAILDRTSSTLERQHP